MPLEACIAETMEELKIGGEKIAIEDAKNLVGATNTETLKIIFTRMDR
jgi:hypothetical protein